ncbi:MAG: right-handed parallel beta-helix repeat-containing protein [Thermoguttaceae bacterium]|nr:right-handed parallel beta-helix repeat-containing protein [Thermoguttaceae bacterium]
MFINSLFGRKNSDSSANSTSSKGVKLNKNNHQPRRMTLEPLESRDLLTVTTGSIDDAEYTQIRAQYPEFDLPELQADLNVMTITPDDGALSLADLKSAIADAGTTTLPDLILVRTTASANSVTYASAEDEISINIDATQYGSITILGWGTEKFTLDANQLSRVMTVTGNNTVVNLGGLTISGGYTTGNGGGIYAGTGSNLTLIDCLVTSNRGNHGGGISSYSALTVINSEFFGNTAAGNGGGINHDHGTLIISDSVISGNQGYDGGGIRDYYSSATTITSSEISGNTATGSGGGISQYQGTIIVTNCEISDNTAVYFGGGLFQNYGSLLSVTDCLISRNAVTSYGGGICHYHSNNATVTNCEIIGNTSDQGGGIYSSESSSMTVMDCVISENVATRYGGGVHQHNNSMTMTNCEISGNIASEYGGGISKNWGSFSGTNLRIVNNAVKNSGASNHSAYGGAISNNGTMILANSEISGNEANAAYTGTSNNQTAKAYGGGIYNTGTLTTTNVTIAANRATYTYTEGRTSSNVGSWGGGIYSSNSMNLYNTIISENSAITGGGVYYSTTDLTKTAKIYNSDIVRNTASQGAGLFTDGLVYVYNSIIALNGDKETDGRDVWTADKDTARSMIACSIIGISDFGTGKEIYGGGNLTGTSENPLNPGFVDAENGDYTLLSTSVAIDKGSDIHNSQETDLAGNERKQGNRVDIGAYEYAKELTGELETPSTVVSTGDDVLDAYDGKISLREAIQYAETGDTITFDSLLFANGGTMELFGLQLTIDKSLTIDASNLSEKIVVDANGMSRAIYIDDTSKSTVVLKNLTITGGYNADHGGGIYAGTGSSLTLEDCLVTSNQTYGSSSYTGGGIYSNGNLTLTNSTFTDNKAAGDRGGAICDYGNYVLTISSCIFSGNKAVSGAGVYQYGGSVEITDCEFSGNSVTECGAGICQDYGTMTIANSLITGNTARQGGGIYQWRANSLIITNSEISGNTGTGAGGGIYNYNGVLSVSNSTISENVSSGSGGGIYKNYGASLTVTDSVFSGNSSSSGGAICHDSATAVIVTDTSITNNYASENGGGICQSYSGTLTVTNCVISGNTGLTRYGGGIHVFRVTANVLDSLISDNISRYGGGVDNESGTFTIKNTRIVNNHAPSSSSGIDVYGGGIRNLDSMILVNCEISGNEANATYTGMINNQTAKSYGGGIYNSGTLTATNVTIAGNSATYSYTDGGSSSYVGSWGGGIYSSNSMNLYNTIIAENEAIAGDDILSTGGTIKAFNNLSSYTDWDMDVNYEYDPESSLFKDKDMGKFELVPNMQAFDRGNNEYAIAAGLGEDSLDLAGNERFRDDSIDIGAYETAGLYVSQNYVFRGSVDFSWLTYQNTQSVRITWISGTAASVLGTFAPSGSWTWNTTQYPDGAGILKIEYLDEDGNVLLNSQQNATIINDENVVVHSGNVTESTTWENDKVHLVVGRVSLKSGADLTIAANTVVKFWKNAYLYNESGANLTIEENVVLTRAEDDEVAGDTNKDGELSVAKMGNSYIRGKGEFVMDPSVTMKFITTAVSSGAISTDQMWLAGQVYHVTGTITVKSGATLTILPGAIVKFDKGCSLEVASGGSLYAFGNAGLPIVFTSVKDDQYGGDTNEDNGEFEPQPGDWNRIACLGGSVYMNYCKVMYGGNTPSDNGALYLRQGTWELKNSWVSQSKYTAIHLEAGVFTAENTIICDSLMGVNVHYFSGPESSTSRASITNCTIVDVTDGVRMWGTSTFTNCIIANVSKQFTYNNDSRTSFQNCVFWNPAGFGPQTCQYASGTNQWANPLFRNAEAGDYYLMAGSPCIDAGDSTVAPETDITGAPRNTDVYSIQTGIPDENGAYADIGAYEFTDNANSSIDLTPVNIQAPTTASIGDTVTIQWTIKNNGSVAAKGSWTDEIYLVSDYGQKVLVSGVSHIGNIASGDLQTFYADIVIPTVLEGNWTFAVQINPNREIYEGSAIDNNFAQSDSKTTIAVPTLSLPNDLVATYSGSIYKLEIKAGEEYYIKAEVPEYSTIGKNYKVNPILIASEGFLPTETAYEWISESVVQNREYYDTLFFSEGLIIGSPINQFYIVSTVSTILHIPAESRDRIVYLNISSSYPNTKLPCSLQRLSSDFRVDCVPNSYSSIHRIFQNGETENTVIYLRFNGQIAYGHQATIEIFGTGFDSSMTAELSPCSRSTAGGIRITSEFNEKFPISAVSASSIQILSPTRALLTFDMPMLEWGSKWAVYDDYNLVVTCKGLTETLNDFLTIYEGETASNTESTAYPIAELHLPDSIRAGRVYEGTVTYRASASGITAPIFILQANEGVQLSLTDDFSDATNTLQAFGIGPKEHAGILTDGNYSFKFYFKTNSTVDIGLYSLSYKDTDAFDDATYFATWKEYHESLANAITRLNKRGKTCNDVQKAYQLAVMEKEGYNVNAVSGYVRDDHTGMAVSNVSLIARWQDGENNWQTEIVKTDETGFYSIEYLPNDVTVYISTVDGLNLSKTSVEVGDKDVNGFNLTMQPFYDFKTRAVNVAGDLVAYVEYDKGSLKNNQSAEMSLVVKNTGTEAVDAAMVFVYATDSQGNQKAIMTLDSLLKDQRYAATVMPDGFSNSLQIMTSGETAGTIQPGETVTIPIYWGGTLRPWDTAGQEISVGILTSDSNIELDLDEMKESMRPEDMSDTQWNILWTRYTSIIGSTWGSYVQAMGELQAYLASVGSTVSDVSSLNQMLLAWAMDIVNPMGTLTSSTDNVVSSLEFSRAYSGGTLANRFADSDLGLGWDHNWNYRLIRSDNGDVLLNMPQGTSILYQVDKTYSGKTVYRTLSDTNMTLVRSADGTYSLTTLDNTVYAFNADGYFTSITDANGNAVTLSYDNGKLTSVADTQNHSLTIAWNEAGKIASVTDSFGNATTYAYDSTNAYLTCVTWSDGRTISYDYETEGAAISAMKSIDYADGTHQYFTYDDLGRVYESHLDNNTQSVTYQLGNTADTLFTYSIYSGEDYQGTVYLNENGQTARTTDALGNTTSYLYDAHGWLVQTVDANGGITQFVYDEIGNVVSISDAAGLPLEFTYTPSGQLAELTDSAGNKTEFVYDEFGNLTTMTRADQTFTSYTYNDDGTVNTYTTRAGETFVYAYNADGTVASVTLSTEANPVAYEYDEKGNLVKITDSNGDETAMTYNASGQLTKVTYANGRYLEYAYDDAGRQTSITDGGSYHIKYAYNALGQLAQVIDGANGNAVLTAYEYDAKGYLVKETNGAGTYTQYAYDSLGYLTSKTTKNASGETLSSFDYTYDALGLISTLTTLDGTWTYGYDPVGQVTSEVFVGLNASDNYSASYVYDVNGNRTSAVINGVEHSYTYNAMNQLLSDGEFTYTYNANGSLLTKTNVETGEVWTYSWNQKEELVAVVSSIGESWEYTYDANGNRTSVTHTDTDGNVTTTEYLYDPTGLGWIVAAIENGEIVETYAYGFELISQIDASGSACYYGSDHLGSVCVVTDASGAVLNEYAYDAFGNVLTSTETVANSFQFVGAYGVISDTAPDSLIHMRARYYDPATGRFISEDPLDLSAGDTNLYRYCGNCVTMGIDPSGLKIKVGGGGTGGLGKNPYPGQGGQNTGSGPGPGPKHGSKKAGGIFGFPEPGSKNTKGEGQGGKIDGEAMVAGGIRLAGVGVGLWIGGQIVQKIGLPGLITGTAMIGLALWIGNPGNTQPYDTGQNYCPVLPPDQNYCPIPKNDNKFQCDRNEKDPPYSTDPNEINGPIGYDFNAVNAGTEDEPLLVITTPNWIASDTAKGQEYRIYFENKSTATAAAQEVFVTMNMPEQFDWNSFELAEICIGNQIFDQMTGYADGVWTVNQTSTGDQIKISFELDDLTGEATWYLRSYVASTADNFPASAYDGFLPPNDDAHSGEGYIAYRVRYDSDLTTGDVVSTSATIVFDSNEPIETNVWLNTIDVDIPVVQMDSAELVGGGVALAWSGSDVGSGIEQYQIYVSADSGAYTLWQSFESDVTSAVFDTQTPGEYSFYILAVDGAGNIGGDPEQATPSILIESDMEMRVVTTSAVHASTDVISDNLETITDWDAFYMEFWTTNLKESQAGKTSTAKILYDSNVFQLDTNQAIAAPAGITAEISDPILESNGMTSIIVTFTVGEDGYTAPGANTYWGAVHFTPNTQDGAGIQNPLESETLDVEMGGAASGTTVKAMPYDLNRDGKVNVDDFILFATVYGTNTDSVSTNDGMYTEKLLSDYDGDGAVSVTDFIAFATNYGLVKGDGKNVTLPQQNPQTNGSSVPNNSTVSESNLVEQLDTYAQPEPAASPIQQASEQVVIAQAASPVYENAIVTESELKSAVQVLRQAHSSALLDLYDNQNQSDAPTALFAKAVDESIVIDDSFDFLFDDLDSDSDDSSDVDLSAVLDELELELI